MRQRAGASADQEVGRQATEKLLLGEGVQAGWFHDNRLGRALDHIDEVGTDTLLSGIVLRDLRGREAEPFSVHLDHTTLSLYGVYETDQQPTPVHGSSSRPTRGPPAGPRALLHNGPPSA